MKIVRNENRIVSELLGDFIVKMEGLTVMVTGGAGFIGSNLVDNLIEKGNRVIVYDNFDEYYFGKENNIRRHLSNPNFVLVRADILNNDALLKAMKGVDVVFHLAAQPGVRFSLENPAKTNSINTVGTINTLQAAKKAEVKKVIFASSSSVYGVPRYMPLDEEHPTEPISIYGVSKLAAEKYCKIYSESVGLPVVILRYHTVYGPRQRPDMAIHKWADLLLKNIPPVIFGDGNQTRDFTYVDDIVEGTILAAETDDIDGEIFNLGCGSRVSINDVVNALIDITGKDNLQPIHQPPKLGDVSDTQADIHKAKKLLGYNPKTGLKEGLRIFVEWFITTQDKVMHKT